ncbi:NF-kappa-B essential modulator-like [Saccostrea echinata]|uniref:NF-kappa-B essential modulator-like n=1 Tax=Saccostrea echinata TaxID=191078 RepID=UPI002A80F66F|nr:NF-kappa-B essential modulator-like [Saccostrea echinata]
MATEMTRNNSTESSLSVQQSLEQERDCYKEKVEHMKVLLKQCQAELHTYKIRHGGVETFSRLLQETKQENVGLVKKVKTLETIIRNFQSRLINNGLSASLSLEESDVFIPGTSKQVLENLSRENSRLKQLLRSSPNDPEEIQTLQQKVKELTQKNSTLQQQLESKVSRLNDLERALSNSADEKDAQIRRLTTTVEELRESSRTRDVLCLSLAEEKNNLQQQLTDVGTQCQQMALRLENSKTKQGAQLKGSDKFSEEIERLREENFSLKSKLEEVTKMNHRWQSYNTMQEQRIQQLMAEMEANQALMVTPEREESINRALEEAKTKLQSMENQKKEFETKLNEALTYNSHLTQEVEKLREEVNSRREGTCLSSNSESIEALKHQIQICTEDFEYERSDREKAQHRISQLEEEMRQIKAERDRYKTRLSQLESENSKRDSVGRNRLPQVNMEYNVLTNQSLYNDFNLNQVNQGYSMETQLAARGPSQSPELKPPKSLPVDVNPIKGQRTMDQGHSGQTVSSSFYAVQNMNEIDSPPQMDSTSPLTRPSFPKNSHEFPPPDKGDTDLGLSLKVPSLNDLDEINDSESETGNGQMLSCPKCGQSFSADCHAQLVEHLDVCCD